jgi:hypothetical protein
VSENEQCRLEILCEPNGTALAAMSDMSGGHISIREERTRAKRVRGPSNFGQKLFGGGQ